MRESEGLNGLVLGDIGIEGPVHFEELDLLEAKDDEVDFLLVDDGLDSLVDGSSDGDGLDGLEGLGVPDSEYSLGVAGEQECEPVGFLLLDGEDGDERCLVAH